MFRRNRLVMATIAICVSVALPGSAQESNLPEQPSPGGWRRADGPPPAEQRAPAPQPEYVRVPSQLMLPAGAWITVRVNQPLSSDHNAPGDAFTATLAQPLVADGFVIARRGQTIGGRVADAQKAGRRKGTSRLALELTEIGLVDGQQLPVRTQLMEYTGGTSVGSDATAIGTATGVGAAIGGVADGGFGAGVGALAGAAASTIGVLVTRGRPTEVYPEAVLTFRTLQPVAISTERSEQAFHPVRQGDYEQRQLARRPAQRPTLMAPYYGGYYSYPYMYSPYFWGPSFYYYSGPRFYGGRGFYVGRGFGGGGRRR